MLLNMFRYRDEKEVKRLPELIKGGKRDFLSAMRGCIHIQNLRVRMYMEMMSRQEGPIKYSLSKMNKITSSRRYRDPQCKHT